MEEMKSNERSKTSKRDVYLVTLIGQWGRSSGLILSGVSNYKVGLLQTRPEACIAPTSLIQSNCH